MACSSAGSGPSSSAPWTDTISLISWIPSSASPRATISALGVVAARAFRINFATRRISPQTATERTTIQDAAHALGAHFVILEASTPSEIESAFATLVGQRVNALVVSGEIFFLTQRDRLVELADRHALPTIYAWREFPVAGGLMSYGTNFKEPYRLIGVYAGRILKGKSRPIFLFNRPVRSS